VAVRSIVTAGLIVPELAHYDRAMLSLLAHWGIPGAALAVAKDGRLVLARGYGLANVEEGEPVLPESLFRIASVSKPLTAMAILRLVEQGRLDLDTPAFSLLDHLTPPPGAQVDPRIWSVTIRQLLQHSGGWDRDQSFDPMFHPSVQGAARELGAPEPLDAATIICVMLGRPLDFDPGTRYAYSNFGYCVLGRVIEQITGQGYEAYVKSELLEPRGITRMQIGATMAEGLAEGEVHYYDPGATTIDPGNRPGLFRRMDAHGGWIASAVDLVRVFSALSDPACPACPDEGGEGREGGSPGAPALLGPETVRQMRARPEPSLWVDADSYYGLGWLVRPAEETTVWSHDGTLPRTVAQAVGNTNGFVHAALFNSRPVSQRAFRLELGRALREAYREVTTWPTHDWFEEYAGPAGEPASVTVLSVDTASDAAPLHQGLVDRLRNDRHIESAPVESAFRAVPRHYFLPNVPLAEAYRNRAIPTRYLDGEVVSSSSEPTIMAIMLEMLDLQPGHTVLEIGAGTGYNAALMAQIVGEAGQVIALDIDEDIVEAARAHLAAAGAEGVRVVRGDGAVGFAEAAPFDRIVLTVAATDISPAWREQLKPDGRLLLPFRVGGILTQKVVLFAPAADHLETVSVRGGWFMMLRGAHAQARAHVPLGPDPGLELWADEPPPIDSESLYQLLAGPGQDWPTGVQVDRGQLWGGLIFWLGLHEPSLCEITASPGSADADRRRWPLRHPSRSFHSTVGLVGEGGLAVLTGPPVTPSEAVSADRTEPYEILVRSYGRADRLARRLLDRIVAWDTAGRPSGNGIRVRAYPAQDAPSPASPASSVGPDSPNGAISPDNLSRGPLPTSGPGEIVIQKRHTRLVVDWP
jgi:protein-L-isoaspartate(D-aspartate) O-methyltransferase